MTLIILAIGAVGTALAFVPAQLYLIGYLELLGIAIPPIGAIYCLDVLAIRRLRLTPDGTAEGAAVRFSAFVAWALAGLGGYASSTYGLGLIGISALDSILIAGLVFVVLNLPRLLQNRPQPEPHV